MDLYFFYMYIGPLLDIQDSFIRYEQDFGLLWRVPLVGPQCLESSQTEHQQQLLMHPFWVMIDCIYKYLITMWHVAHLTWHNTSWDSWHILDGMPLYCGHMDYKTSYVMIYRASALYEIVVFLLLSWTHWWWFYIRICYISLWQHMLVIILRARVG